MILLCISVLCVMACVCLLIAYRNMPAEDGEALESLRDEIKEFETFPPETADTAPPETVGENTTDAKPAGENTTADRYTGDGTTESKPGDETATPAKPVGESTTAGKPTGTTAAEETTGKQSVPDDTDGDTVAPDTKMPETTTADKTPSRVPSASLNFEKLWEINPEICAWLEIPDTRIDYPVVQSPDDDKKYLTKAYNGSRYVGGALFTEATYNGTDFNDPVTIIYGHTMNSGMLFGDLQKNYSSASGFEKNKSITLYLPGEVRQYTVFAAVPYDRIHILHTYDFTNAYWYGRFFTDVGRIRAIGANFDRDSFPVPGDRVLILSVCLNEDTAKRYLVMAVLEEDLADNGTDFEE